MDLNKLQEELKSQDWWTPELLAAIESTDSVLEAMEIINAARNAAYPASDSTVVNRRSCNGNCRGCKGGSCRKGSCDA